LYIAAVNAQTTGALSTSVPAAAPQPTAARNGRRKRRKKRKENLLLLEKGTFFSDVLMARRLLRVGFYGAGDVSSLHADALQRSSRAELAGLWNRSSCAIVPDPAERARAYGGVDVYASAEALALDPEIDAIYVLTAMESHCELALLAMENGKHVYVEKPVASSVAEIETLMACAAANETLCFPGHNYVYEPSLMRVREMIDAGTLGAIAHLAVQYNIQHPAEVCARLPGVIRQILTVRLASVFQPHHSAVARSRSP
jgi:hypothetical protein